MFAYIGIGYSLALVLSPLALLIAVLTTVFGIAYSKTFKRHAIMGNLDRGLLACFTVLFAGAAVHSLEAEWSLLVLCAIFFFHDSSSNLIGAIRDRDGDRAAGCRTVPVAYGIPLSIRISGILTLSWVTIAVPLFVRYHHRELAVTLFALALLLTALVYLMLLRRMKGLTPREALAAHKLVVLERLVLSSAVAAIYGPAPKVLLLLVVAVAATQVAQALLRNRYEFASR